MALFEGGGLLFLALIVFWLWALYDVITVEPSKVRNLPKVLWIVVVILLGPFFAIGAFLWVFLGRPARTGAPGGRPTAPRRPRRAPEPEPETDMHAKRVVTDRRSAELDRMLEEWERSRRGEGTPEP
jgi:Phospholipase_D-nuclease N-terminal